LPRLARPLRAGALGPILRANLMSVRLYLVSCRAGPIEAQCNRHQGPNV
jgi:hypothetical protein